VTDAAGNPIEIERTASFRTASNDVDGPQIVSVAPADGATHVALNAPIDVTLNEAIDPATVTPTSFRVEIDGQTVTGLRTFTNSNRGIRFQPAEPWTAGATVTVTLATSIADPSGNTLADANGVPLTAPVVTTFTTTTFGITSPTGTSVVEETQVLLEARASNTAGIASVVFTVNGVDQPPASPPAFSQPFVVPSAVTTTTLIIRASARNALGAEVASDERTFEVVIGLRVTPTLAGVPLGGSTGLRFTLSSALTTDLPIELRAGNASLVTFLVNPVVLPAGATEVTALVVGAAEGNTAVFGESDRGTASSIVSVSPRVDGQTLTPSSQPIGISISNPPSAGLVVLGTATTDTARLRLLTEAAAVDQTVTIVSTNAAVATATAGPLLAGQLAADVTITTGVQGVATLIIRVGDVVRAVTVIVGTPPAGSLPLILASPAGVAISNPPNVGHVVVSPGTSAAFTSVVLAGLATAETPVLVESSNPAVATATASAIASGSASTTLSVNAISAGVVTLIIRAGGEVRAVTLYVGAPPAGQEPILLAAPVGIAISNAPSIGQLVSATGVGSATELVVLPAAAAEVTEVSVTSSDPTIATATADPIAAGSRTTILRVATAADGIARLTLRAGAQTWTVTVFVGNVPVERRPVLVASPVGASIAALSQLGTVVAQPGTPIVSSLGIQLLAAPRLSAVTVSAQSSDTAIATVNGAATTTAELSAGQAVLGLTIATTGLEGTAVITFEFDGQRLQLLVVVGNPPASQRPAIGAPVLGVRIGG
jgi:hypothetical protein